MEQMKQVEQLQGEVRLWTGIGFCVIPFFILSFLTFTFVFALIGMVFAIIGFGISNSKSKKFKKLYKDLFIRSALESTIEELEYDPEVGFSKDEVDHSDLYSMGNRFYSNDYVAGKYHDVHFRQSDVLIQNVQSTGKTTTTTTYFKGRWYIIDFSKPLKGYTRVREKELLDFHFNWFSNTEKISTESIEFNNIFQVVTTDGQEAFYVLSPQIMEAILEVEKHFEGTIGFAFFDNKVHIAVYNNQDYFEPPVWSKIDEQSLVNSMQGIHDIFYIIDTLKLNNTLFK